METLSSMFLEADMQAFFVHCNLPLTKELRDSSEAMVRVMGSVEGIFNNYITRRGSAQGEMIRATLCQIAIEWSLQGGKGSSESR